MEKAVVSIIYCYRNRETERLRRSLDSLKNQNLINFEVIFIDFGSDPQIAKSTEDLIHEYPFCKYIYNDARGLPWNRSHALNTGIRFANCEYVFTADVDMIFTPNFTEVLAMLTHPEKAFFFCVNYLQPGFNKWEKLKEFEPKNKSESFALGLALIPKAALEKINSYDEFYCFWGMEDNDIEFRLRKSGLVTKFYEDVLMHHQWHSSVSDSNEWMPRGWRQFQQDYFEDNEDRLIRNETVNWGRIFKKDQRKVLLTKEKEFHLHFRANYVINKLNTLLYELESGSIINIVFSDRKSNIHTGSNLGKIKSIANKVMSKSKIPLQLETEYRSSYSTVFDVRDELMYFIYLKYYHIADYAFQIKGNEITLAIEKR